MPSPNFLRGALAETDLVAFIPAVFTGVAGVFFIYTGFELELFERHAAPDQKNATNPPFGGAINVHPVLLPPFTLPLVNKAWNDAPPVAFE